MTKVIMCGGGGDSSLVLGQTLLCSGVHILLQNPEVAGSHVMRGLIGWIKPWF